MDISGKVTISINDFDKLRNQYKELHSKIKSVYMIHNQESGNKYMELKVNDFLNLVEDLENNLFGLKFQRQDENIIIGTEKIDIFNVIDDDDIPF